VVSVSENEKSRKINKKKLGKDLKRGGPQKVVPDRENERGKRRLNHSCATNNRKPDEQIKADATQLLTAAKGATKSK